MYVMHIALGGCIKPPPISYGLTQDTGGHIAYVLGAATAQSRRRDIARVDIVTRYFIAPQLGKDYALPRQELSQKLAILRLRSRSDDYLTKEALEAELPSLTTAFLEMLDRMHVKPDVLHCHFADAAELGAAARARFHMPMIYTPHSLAFDKLAGVTGDYSARLRRETAAIKGADAIIASSRDEAECQIAAYDADSAGRVWRINPGIDLPAAPTDGAAERLLSHGLQDPGRPFLLAIARPVAKKNLCGLMRAYLGSGQLQAAANLVILAGQSSDEPEQCAIRAELAGMADSLPGKILLPLSHRAELVPQLYRQAALQGGLFVNPALHEPFGLTLIEAARFGLPVVATRHGGPVDISDSIGHARLIDPQDPAHIAAECATLLTDRVEWRRLSRNALNNHLAFDWSLWAERMALIIRKLTRPTAPLRPMPLPRTLLAFDIDGTLTGCAPSASVFTRWLERPHPDWQPMIATGRSISEARRILADWAIAEPAVMITSVGSEIWRRDRRGSMASCRDYAAWIGVDWQPEAIRAALASLALQWQLRSDQRRWKISLFGDQGTAEAMKARLQVAGLPARVVPSHGRFIDILPRAAGKVGALSFEAARLGLTLADCVTAGDSGNDACMLAAAGRAILPANALSELQLDDRPGLYRARGRHAAGVLEGLTHFGFTEHTVAMRVPAE